MKHVISKVCAFLMSLTLLVGLMPAIDAEAYDPNADLGTVTISGVTNNNKFVGYKIMNITYNATTNQVSYAWASDAIKTAIGVTPEAFEKLDEEGRKNSLVAVAKLVSGMDKSLTEVTASDNKAVFSNVSIGGYLIVPTSTDEVYQTMMAVVQPVAGDTGYATVGATVAAKKNPLGITKTVAKDNTGMTEKVSYTVVADVPTYPDDATDKTYKISDTLRTGLNYVDSSLVVKGVASDDSETSLGTETVTDGAYTFTKTDAQNFSITFTYDKIKTYSKIKLEYKAVVNENASMGIPDGNATNNRNTATLTYSHYPYIANAQSTDTSTVDVYTFGLKVVKKDATYDTKKLAGAEFDLYREATAADDAGVKLSGENRPEVLRTGDTVYVKVNTSTITTDANGEAQVSRLAEGAYYLVETKTPNGYTLPSNAFTVTISRNDNKMVTATGIQTAEITNVSGFTLPQTGGSGTVVFTIVGISLMLAAVVVFFVLRRKETHKK